ncbi:MAG: hypothetical protein SPH32_03175 [Erysipelotrichaceae bacterium]|nr:hypothetical protein [Erysipelotrichaceae bacterium]
MYYFKFILGIIIFNFVLSIIFYNPNLFFLALIAFVGYIAYRSHKISKQKEQFFNDFNQTYQEDINQRSYDNKDIIDVEYTQKDISDDR